jgi:hypothetical protein
MYLSVGCAICLTFRELIWILVTSVVKLVALNLFVCGGFVRISFAKGEYSRVEYSVNALKIVELNCAVCKAVNTSQYLHHIISWNQWGDISPGW